MVGVAGRSKACHTCKRRRIACDAGRPQCSQCLKSKLVCGGYQKDTVFVHTKPVSPNIGRKRRHIRPETEQALVASRRKAQQATVSKHIFPYTHQTNGFGGIGDTWDLLDLQNSQCRQQLLSTFLASFLPKDTSSLADLNLWITCLPDHPSTSRCLESSTGAVCLARMGRMYDDKHLLFKSKELYASGLGELQRDLWNPKSMYRDETLAACMNLALYELMECPGKDINAYASHQGGLARLVQLRGPEAHTDGIAHNMFLAFRVQTTLQAIKDSKPTYMSSPLWTETPWKNKPKAPVDRLIDFLTQAPEIYVEVSRLGHLSPQALLTKTLDLIDRCWELHDEVQAFFSDYESTLPGPLYEPFLSTETNPADNPSDGKVFPVAFHFRNLGLANIAMWYWTIKLLVCSGMADGFYSIIHNMKSDPQIANAGCGYCDACLVEQPGCLTRARLDGLRPLGECKDYWTLAWNICQSFEYYMQMMGIGPIAVTAPLTIVAEILKSHPEKDRETRWVKASLKKVEERGLRFLGFVDCMD